MNSFTLTSLFSPLSPFIPTVTPPQDLSLKLLTAAYHQLNCPRCYNFPHQTISFSTLPMPTLHPLAQSRKPGITLWPFPLLSPTSDASPSPHHLPLKHMSVHSLLCSFPGTSLNKAITIIICHCQNSLLIWFSLPFCYLPIQLLHLATQESF